jgi:hypothetical protein
LQKRKGKKLSINYTETITINYTTTLPPCRFVIKGYILRNYIVLKLSSIEKFIPIPHLTPGLKKEYSCASALPLGLHGLFWD